MVLCGTKNGSSMASLEEPFEAPLFLRVYIHIYVYILSEYIYIYIYIYITYIYIYINVKHINNIDIYHISFTYNSKYILVYQTAERAHHHWTHFCTYAQLCKTKGGKYVLSSLISTLNHIAIKLGSHHSGFPFTHKCMHARTHTHTHTTHTHTHAERES